MNYCTHTKFKLLGVKETEQKNQFSILANCVKCGSTISLNKKQITKILLDTLKKKD
ncbi:hypothetical protein ES705_14674 [subsurface metagenome]